MLKSYEATYNHGRLKWVREKPVIDDGRQILVVVESSERARHRPEEIRKALDESRGAWGRGKTPDEIDSDIEDMRRADWHRTWNDGSDDHSS